MRGGVELETAGWIVGTSLSVLVLLVGIIGMLVSKQRRTRNKWSIWLILFGVCALVSAFINAGFK